MILRNLNIVNYKNIAEVSVSCCSRFNCFIGNNGVGKTNVLDAVYQLSMCKSYFNLPDAQNIRHGEAFFMIEGQYVHGNEEIDVYCGVKRGQKKIFKKNKKAYIRLSDHIGLLPLVIISPADVVLIDGASEERRRCPCGMNNSRIVGMSFLNGVGLSCTSWRKCFKCIMTGLHWEGKKLCWNIRRL